MSIPELAAKFLEIRSKCDEISNTLKAIISERDEAEKRLIEAMADSGMSSVKLEGMGLFSARTKHYLNVSSENKPSFFEYLKESGNGDLLKLDVNSNTLKAFLSQHLEELAAKRVAEGLDPVDARKFAIETLEGRGAKCFTDRAISFKRET